MLLKWEKGWQMKFKKNILLGILVTAAIVTSQLVLVGKHFQFGYFIDDWNILAKYRPYQSHSASNLLSDLKLTGLHEFSRSYYIGIMYQTFHLNYFPQQLINQILQILAALSFFFLIWYIFKSKLLAFLTALIYSLHFAPVGSFDNVYRGQEFLAIILMNLFGIGYFYVWKKKIANNFILLGLASLLFVTIFVDPSRLFPLLIFIPLLELLLYMKSKTSYQLTLGLKRLLILYSFFILALIFAGSLVGEELKQSLNILPYIWQGNLHLLKLPLASFGSLFVPQEFWGIFGHVKYTDFTIYLWSIKGAIFIFFLFNLSLAIQILKKPWIFAKKTFIFNLLAAIPLFFIDVHYHQIVHTLRTGSEPYIYITPAIIGLFIINTGIFLSQSLRVSGLAAAMIFSLTFIILTQLRLDPYSVPMNVHPYLNIPSMGASLFLAILLTYVYQYGKSRKVAILTIGFTLILFFIISSITLNNYFVFQFKSGWGGDDQDRIRSKFFSEVKNVKNFNQDNLPLFYFETQDYPNGAFYSNTVFDRFQFWLSIDTKNYQLATGDPCPIRISGKSALADLKVTRIKEQAVLIHSCNNQTYIHQLENFYAFRMENRGIQPIKEEILEELGGRQ